MVSVESVRVPFPSRLVNDYLWDFPAVAEFFDYDPHDPESFLRRYEHLQENFRADRRALAAALAGYNRRLGADQAALANAERLADPGVACVLGGQQAGVLTGPLYTVWKAISILQLTRRVEAAGIPAVPVFWVAAEDHDFAEIDHLDLVDREHRLVRLRLDLDPGPRRSVGHVPVGQAVFRLLDEVDALTPPTEFKGRILGKARELAEAATDLADWFGRLMAWLFRDTGLVLVNPLEPDFRRLQAEVLAGFVRRRPAVTAALEAARDRLRARGYEPTVELREPGVAHLFIYHDGERLPLVAENGRLVARGAELSHTEAELEAVAREAPWRLSPSVVLRPVGQDAVLPTLAYLSGPGEISYYALFREVHTVCGRQMPVIVPRAYVTLVERQYRRAMEKYGLSFADVVGDLDARLREWLAGQDRVGLDELFATVKREVAGQFQSAARRLGELDPNLRGLARNQLGRAMKLVVQLEQKARQSLRRREEVAVRQFEKLRTHLFPRENFQERVFNCFPYLFKYDLALLDAVDRLPLLDDPGHKVVYIGT